MYSRDKIALNLFFREENRIALNMLEEREIRMSL